jgi:hypothetical protein
LEKLSDDDDASAASNKIQAPVMTGPEANRIAKSMVGIAKKIEDNGKNVITAATAAPAQETTHVSACI